MGDELVGKVPHQQTVPRDQGRNDVALITFSLLCTLTKNKIIIIIMVADFFRKRELQPELQQADLTANPIPTTSCTISNFVDSVDPKSGWNLFA